MGRVELTPPDGKTWDQVTDEELEAMAEEVVSQVDIELVESEED